MMLSRRTIVIAGCIPLLPRAALAVDSSEQMAELLIADAVNQGRLRLAPALPLLIRDSALDGIARERSQDMAHGAPFAHENSKGGFAAVEKIRDRYSRYGAMGENIMMDFDPAGRGYEPHVLAQRAVKSWFDSEGHRDNILSPAFTHSGVGVAASRTMVYATQVFWGPPAKRDPRHSG